MDSTSLLFFQSEFITCTYLYLNEGLSGIKFINPLVNTKLSKVIVNYLVVWYNEHANKTNHSFYINNMQFHNNNADVYSLQIKQFDTSSNITIIITNVSFTSTPSLNIVCVNCTGHSSTIISDCNFTSDISYYDYDYNDSYDELEYFNTPPCENRNAHNTNSTVYAYYEDCENTSTPNNMQFINCFFVNNYGSRQLIQIAQNSYFKNNSTDLIISISDCVFHNNQYTRFLSVGSYNNDLNYCTLLLIKNTTISYNTCFQESLVFVYMTKVVIDQVKFISNTGIFDYRYHKSHDSVIFTAHESYLEFNGYNNFFNNTVSVAIYVSPAHIQEHSMLNFTFNTFLYVIYTISAMLPLLDLNSLKLCPFQYVNEKGT